MSDPFDIDWSKLTEPQRLQIEEALDRLKQTRDELRDLVERYQATRVPRWCDDIYVQRFLNWHLMAFRPDQPEALLSASEVFAAARLKFGDLRCIDVAITIH